MRTLKYRQKDNPLSMRSSLFAASLGLFCLAAFAAAPAAFGAGTIYFAEDLNHAGDTVRVTPTNSLAKRDQFLAALTGAVTDTLETQTAGSAQPWTLAFGRLTGTGPNTVMVSLPSPTGTIDGRFPFSGSIFFQQADEYEPVRYSATLALTTAQRAFGFLVSDWGDAGPLDGTRPTVRVTYLDNTTETFVAPASILGTDISGSAAFFGLTTDQAFQSVEIINGTGSRTAGYDDFTVASQLVPVAAPEPGSMAFFLLGLGAGAGLVRRRGTNV